MQELKKKQKIKIRFKKLLIGFLFSLILLALLFIFKPALAMAPPPASHIWLFLRNGSVPPGPVCGNGTCEAGETAANCQADCGGTSQAIVVKVEWPEGLRTEKIELKTFLKN